MNKQGEVDSFISWVFACLILAFVLALFLFFTFSISAGKTIMGEKSVSVHEGLIDRQTEKDLLLLLGRSFVVEGKSTTVLSSIRSGVNEYGNFVSEGNEVVVKEISDRLYVLCAYELAVGDGYFMGSVMENGFFQKSNSVSNLFEGSERVAQRFANKRGTLVATPYTAVYRDGIKKGLVISLVRVRTCEGANE